jgi:predicted DNA-binding transcriptional regulator AlpA
MMPDTLRLPVPDSGTPPTAPAPLEPLLVSSRQAAALVGISVASWHRLRAAGKTPLPLRLSGSVRYRTEDLRLWVSLGCPDRKTFESYKAARNAKK